MCVICLRKQPVKKSSLSNGFITPNQPSQQFIQQYSQSNASAVSQNLAQANQEDDPQNMAI
jgi:hypothetical protein